MHFCVRPGMARNLYFPIIIVVGREWVVSKAYNVVCCHIVTSLVLICEIILLYVRLMNSGELSRYHACMLRVNVFSCISVCVSVRPSVCLSVYLSVCNALTFERQDLQSLFLVCRYIFRIFSSHSSIKVIASRSRSQSKTACLCLFVGDGLSSVEGNLVYNCVYTTFNYCLSTFVFHRDS